MGGVVVIVVMVVVDERDIHDDVDGGGAVT